MLCTGQGIGGVPYMVRRVALRQSQHMQTRMEAAQVVGRQSVQLQSCLGLSTCWPPCRQTCLLLAWPLAPGLRQPHCTMHCSSWPPAESHC